MGGQPHKPLDLASISAAELKARIPARLWKVLADSLIFQPRPDKPEGQLIFSAEAQARAVATALLGTPPPHALPVNPPHDDALVLVKHAADLSASQKSDANHANGNARKRKLSGTYVYYSLPVPNAAPFAEAFGTTIKQDPRPGWNLGSDATATEHWIKNLPASPRKDLSPD